jgi:hypothetical protein
MLGERHGSLGSRGHVNVAMISTDGEYFTLSRRAAP